MNSNFQIELIPILTDNYVFCFWNKTDGRACLVDPGEAPECLSFLLAQNLELDTILITHHHADHIGGIRDLQERCPKCRVIAPIKNRSQIPMATEYCKHDDAFSVCGHNFKVFELPGHTLGHVGYYEPHNKIFFSGDVLFGCGCGRLFEGSFEQMFETLQMIKKLPADTSIYCTHEYTQRNLQFLDSVIRENSGLTPISKDEYLLAQVQVDQKMKVMGRTVPLSLKFEQQFNPFMRAHSVREFRKLRTLRNSF